MTTVNRRPFSDLGALEQSLVRAMGISDDGGEHTIKVDRRRCDIAALAEQVQTLLEDARLEGRKRERLFLTHEYERTTGAGLRAWTSVLHDMSDLAIWDEDHEDYLDYLFTRIKKERRAAKHDTQSP